MSVVASQEVRLGADAAPLQRGMQQAAASVRQAAGQIQQSGAIGARGAMVLSQALNDTQQFAYGARAGIIAISNQIPQLIALIGGTGRAAQALQAAAGPLTLALSLASTAFVLLTNNTKKSTDALREQTEAATKARRELLLLRGTQAGEGAFTLKSGIEGLEESIAGGRRSLADIERRGKRFVMGIDPETGRAYNTGFETEEYRRVAADVENRVRRLAQAEDTLARTRALNRNNISFDIAYRQREIEQLAAIRDRTQEQEAALRSLQAAQRTDVRRFDASVTTASEEDAAIRRAQADARRAQSQERREDRGALRAANEAEQQRQRIADRSLAARKAYNQTLKGVAAEAASIALDQAEALEQLRRSYYNNDTGQQDPVPPRVVAAVKAYYRSLQDASRAARELAQSNMILANDPKARALEAEQKKDPRNLAGQFKPELYADGSVDAASERLRRLQDAYSGAATAGERSGVYEQIKATRREIERMTADVLTLRETAALAVGSGLVDLVGGLTDAVSKLAFGFSGIKDTLREMGQIARRVLADIAATILKAVALSAITKALGLGAAASPFDIGGALLGKLGVPGFGRAATASAPAVAPMMKLDAETLAWTLDSFARRAGTSAPTWMQGGA